MRVGLVGCGTLGTALGLRLLNAGHALAVHDRNPDRAEPLVERSADWFERAAEMAAGVELLVSALPTPHDVENLFCSPDGPWEAARPRTIHLETSTIGADCVARLAVAARPAKIRLLDRPISRGALHDDTIDLVAWVGGDANYFDLARPVLECMVDRVVYCGALGHGQITKLVNNLIAHSVAVIAGEALAVGAKSGLSVDLMSAALQHGTGQTRVLDELFPGSVFRGDWRPGLRLDLAIKDLDLAADLAARHGVNLVALERLRKRFDEASRRGWAADSVMSVTRLVEEESDVRLRSETAGSAESAPDTQRGKSDSDR